MAAEQDGLAQQARAAWALLDERSAAAHELEAVKQQQLDENNRLRATLEEWSHRNARCRVSLGACTAYKKDCEALLLVQDPLIGQWDAWPINQEVAAQVGSHCGVQAGG